MPFAALFAEQTPAVAVAAEHAMTALLLKIATILVAGIIGGELIAKINLPKVTGWIETGILLRLLSMPTVASCSSGFHASSDGHWFGDNLFSGSRDRKIHQRLCGNEPFGRNEPSPQQFTFGVAAARRCGGGLSSVDQ